MSVNSELAKLNSTGNGRLGDLPDRGTETGCVAGDSYGTDCSLEAVNRLGSVNADSDPVTAKNTNQ